MHGAIVRVCTGVVFGCLIWGCAPLTEQQLYERAERLTIAKEQYYARAQQCESRGGAMSMRTRPLEKPGYLDYQSATCIRR
jgi:hypothetical protein